MDEQKANESRNERLGGVLVENGLDAESARNILMCPELAKCAVEAIKRALDIKARRGTGTTEHGDTTDDGQPFLNNYFW